MRCSDILAETVCTEAAEALADFLWVARPDIAFDAVLDETLDITIALDALQIGPKETLQFALTVTHGAVIETFQPESELLTVTRFPKLSHPLPAKSSQAKEIPN